MGHGASTSRFGSKQFAPRHLQERDGSGTTGRGGWLAERPSEARTSACPSPPAVAARAELCSTDEVPSPESAGDACDVDGAVDEDDDA